jgi:ribosomal protein S18 acetylase RimI-like enzyme
MDILKGISEKISNCVLNDSNSILSLYKSARDLQTQKGMVVWPIFEKDFIENEINEQRQWKLVIDDTIACNWAITFSDKEIWGEKDKKDSIYIHRIATNPIFRGNRYIDKIVVWAKEYAKQRGKRFVRLDTLGNNTRLIEHYTSAGFQFLGMFELSDTSNLPGHYQDEPNCCLFEIDLDKTK